MQTSTPRPERGCIACSTALRSLTEDEDEDRECREGIVGFSLRGGLKDVEGGEAELKGKRRREERGGRICVEGR